MESTSRWHTTKMNLKDSKYPGPVCLPTLPRESYTVYFLDLYTTHTVGWRLKPVADSIFRALTKPQFEVSSTTLAHWITSSI